MFHELLVALSGTPGGIFKEGKNHDLQVIKNLPFVHPSEIEVLDKICSLGGFYMKFQSFIQQYSVDLSPVSKILNKKDSSSADKRLRGQYLHAFCVGLDAVLQPYRDTLVKIEEQVIRDPHIPLSFVHQGLENYFFTFPSLDAVVRTIEDKKVHGCSILELLKENSNCGIPAVKECLESILHICHGVLYKQLSAWMLNGILLDPYKEFFVADQQIQDASTSKSSGVDDEDEVDGAMMSTNKELFNEMDDLSIQHEEVQRFSILPTMLPTYIPLRVADKILFVGRSVHMLKDTEALKSYHYHGKATNILQGREGEFLQRLHLLQKQPQLSIPALETEIDQIKLCVAEQLWTLVVEDADLVKHLKLMKEMYLIGRGELFLTFIDNAQMMKAPPSTTVAYDVNAAFKQSLAKILTYSEEYENLFSMTLDLTAPVEKDKDTIPTSWDYLKMNYKPPWPLHLLFTPNVMEKYSTLFSFLLKVRRTQIKLQGIWALQMTHKRSANTCITANTWSLQRHMSFFVDNLQYYLQVDVLETQFAHLLKTIAKKHDFESIHSSHDNFLVNMHTQSFISMKKVYASLNKVLNICMQLCELINTNRDHWQDMDISRVDQLSKEFHLHSSLLFRMLSSVHSHQTSAHLAQLLLRVDFNKFFTRTTSGPQAFSDPP